jgi:hypothetical protein
MFPYVALNLALRNPKLTVGTRKGLIQDAFSVFFEMALKYPATEQDQGIFEKCGPDFVKTFWTCVMLTRPCNLCVGVDWALGKWGLSREFWLALARIRTHPVECHFGITRSTLNGNAHWDKFFAAQVTAVMVKRIMWQFDLRPDIRRFRNEAGCILGPEHVGELSIDFDLIVEMIRDVFGGLWRNKGDELVQRDVTIITPFEFLSQELGRLQYVEKIKKVSKLSGDSITTRLIQRLHYAQP